MTTKKRPKRTSSPKKNLRKKGNNVESQRNFPGYPKYNTDEDITRKATRIDQNLDDEVLTQVKHNREPKLSPDEGKTDDIDNSSETESIRKNDFEVTGEDLEALGPKDLSLDMGDDEQLKHRSRPVDFTGNDLDVPGSELDDEQEEKGSEDEENNSYSQSDENKD